MPVTARFEDGTAGVYNTVAEALDQAVYDEECGYRKLKDVIDGEHDDHNAVERPRQKAGRGELQGHRTEWRKKWGVVAGVLMLKDDAERILSAERADAKARSAG